MAHHVHARTARVAALFCIWLFGVPTAGQQGGGQNEEAPVEIDFKHCTLKGGCEKEKASLTLDANWRWLHVAGQTDQNANCFLDDKWVEQNCPDEKTCAKKCTLDGVTAEGYEKSYGITNVPGGIRLQFVTKGEYAINVGSRLFMLAGEGEGKYKMFKLKNREFTFTVDSSTLPCGINGAVYFVNMKEDGGKEQGNAGAKYGTGYCDAQCPHDPKFIDGKANLKNWDDKTSMGHYGVCCPEMDLWEANKLDTAYTAHPCDVVTATRCEGTECGDLKTEERYKGLCDKDGCDFNSYRMGNESFYGPGMIVDSKKPITVVTQFLTDDATDDGVLSEIRRFYVQDGKIISNSHATNLGEETGNSLTDEFCTTNKQKFNDIDDFGKKGGLEAMGDALDEGMVFVVSLWDDILTDMGWLDTAFPLDKKKSAPGVMRGPCPRDSGEPKDLRKNSPDAAVEYTDFLFGEIGSTYEGLPKGDERKKALSKMKGKSSAVHFRPPTAEERKQASDIVAKAANDLLSFMSGDANDKSNDSKLLRLDAVHALISPGSTSHLARSVSLFAAVFAVVGLVLLTRRQGLMRRFPSSFYERVMLPAEDANEVAA